MNTTFIDRVHQVHGTRYDTSGTMYVNRKTKVSMVCYIHGEFQIYPSNVLTGSGCPECGRVSMRLSKIKDTNWFIARATKIHGHKFDYSLVVYTDSQTHVIITCPIHGTFSQRPTHHLRSGLNNFGCPSCAHEYRVDLDRSKTTTLTFIDRAKLVHGNVYDYSLVDYVDYTTHVTIVCPVHGPFYQTPSTHVTIGCGCPLCASESNPGVYVGTKHQQQRMVGRNGYTYCVKMQSDCEVFYKIGICAHPNIISRRFGGSRMRGPYQIHVVWIARFGTYQEAYEYEQLCHSTNVAHKYRPIHKFAGHTECFSAIHLPVV